MRDIVAEFHKTAGGRLRLFSMVVIQDSSLTIYDVEYSRAYGYIVHESGGGGDHVIEASGIYWVSGNPEVKELPCQWVDGMDKPPWKGKGTLAIRKRNRTRRLAKLPKQFDLDPGEDLLDWLERCARQEDAVWCSRCRDWLPGDQLCQHCWWCDKTGWYSTPDERCRCKSREECRDEEAECATA